MHHSHSVHLVVTGKSCHCLHSTNIIFISISNVGSCCSGPQKKKNNNNKKKIQGFQGKWIFFLDFELELFLLKICLFEIPHFIYDLSYINVRKNPFLSFKASITHPSTITTLESLFPQLVQRKECAIFLIFVRHVTETRQHF